MLALSGWCPRICQEGLGEAEGTIRLGVVQCLRRVFRSKAILWNWKYLGTGLLGRCFTPPHFLSGKPVFKWNSVQR